MSDLSTFVSNIKNESSGELVRDSVVKAADECNRAGTNYSSLGGIPADDYLLMRELSEGIKDVREDVNNANGEVVGGGIKSDLNLMLETKENIRDAINEISGIEDFCTKKVPFFEYGDKIRKIHDGVLGDSFRIKRNGTYYAEINDPPNQGWKKLNVQVGLPTVKVVNRFYDKNNPEQLLQEKTLYDEMPIGSVIRKIDNTLSADYKDDDKDYIEVEDSGDGNCYIDYLWGGQSYTPESQEIPEDTISDTWEEIVQHPGIYPIGSIKKLDITIDDEPIILIMELVYKGEDNTNSTWISKNLVDFVPGRERESSIYIGNKSQSDIKNIPISANILCTDILENTIFKSLPTCLKQNIKCVNKITSYIDSISNIPQRLYGFCDPSNVDHPGGYLGDMKYNFMYDEPYNKFYSDFKNKQYIWIPSVYELFGGEYIDDLFTSTCLNYYNKMNTESKFKYGFIKSEKDGITYSDYYDTNLKRVKYTIVNNELIPQTYTTRSDFCLSPFSEIKTYRVKSVHKPINIAINEPFSDMHRGYWDPKYTRYVNGSDSLFLSNRTIKEGVSQQITRSIPNVRASINYKGDLIISSVYASRSKSSSSVQIINKYDDYFYAPIGFCL